MVPVGLLEVLQALDLEDEETVRQMIQMMRPQLEGTTQMPCSALRLPKTRTTTSRAHLSRCCSMMVCFSTSQQHRGGRHLLRNQTDIKRMSSQKETQHANASVASTI